MDEWFDGFIANLRSHQLQLETGTAPKETENVYKAIFGDRVEFTYIVRKGTTQEFVKNIIYDYLKEIDGMPVLRMAFNHTDSHVLVWAEIEDNDDQSEKELILAEARVNAKYHQYGFTISTTIIEKSDELDTPSQYILYKETELAEL